MPRRSSIWGCRWSRSWHRGTSALCGSACCVCCDGGAGQRHCGVSELVSNAVELHDAVHKLGTLALVICADADVQ
eukprot:6911790-Prymnesium_polylepis.1